MIEVDAKKYDRYVLDLPRLSLTIGDWRHEFREEEYKMIIADAFNHCTDPERSTYEIEDVKTERDRIVAISIVGYLITDKMVHLVLLMDPELRKEEEEELTILFKQNLNKKLQETLDGIHSIKHYERHGIPLIDAEDNVPGGFSKYMNFMEAGPFNNYDLIKLLTGYRVERPYYDPQLERLKDRLHSYRFCSLVDYSGAVGPVIIGKLKNQIN
ncbi:MAG: hypothetical protein IPL84_01785 [Chitinophagaceae bacterium]|nr:hypothetical protein [Chitinophagaceae bacterium]